MNEYIQRVRYEDTAVWRLTADEGYELPTEIEDCNKCEISQGELTYGPVTEDVDIYITCEKPKKEYNVSIDIDNGIVVSGDNPQTVTEGERATWIVRANEGYEYPTIVVNGKNTSHNGDEYVIVSDKIYRDMHVHIDCSKEDTYSEWEDLIPQDLQEYNFYGTTDKSDYSNAEACAAHFNPTAIANFNNCNENVINPNNYIAKAANKTALISPNGEFNLERSELTLTELGYDLDWLNENRLDIYRWEIACFNGIIEEDISNALSSNPSSVEVAAPSQRLWADIFDNTISSKDVYIWKREKNDYCAVYKDANGIYYTEWANSNEWNETVNNKIELRKDKLFSDISKDTEENCISYQSTYFSGGNGRLEHTLETKAKRDTYIYYSFDDEKYDFINIDSLFVNSMASIKTAINSNNGNLKLSTNKMYYCSGFENQKQNFDLKSKSNFVIDGNNSILFCRTAISGLPSPHDEFRNRWDTNKNYTVFEDHDNNKNVAHDYIIRNLKLYALRDKDCGCPKSENYQRCSSSDSHLCAMSMCGYNADIYNIEIHGYTTDIASQGDKTYIKRISNVRNYDVNGTHIKSATYLNNCIYRQAPMIGGGPHLNYSGNNSNCFITNTIYKAVDNNSEVLLTHHAANSDTTETCNYYYLNCIVEGGELFHGSGAKNDNYHYRNVIHFKNCYLHQVFDKYWPKNNNSVVECLYYPIKMSSDMDNCEMKIEDGIFNKTAIISYIGGINATTYINNNEFILPVPTVKKVFIKLNKNYELYHMTKSCNNTGENIDKYTIENYANWNNECE